MKKIGILTVSNKITRYSNGLGGVFSYSDLSNIIASGSPISNSRLIKRLEREHLLTRVMRGIYVTESFDPRVLAYRIDPGCYISMDSALANEGFIGTVPRGRLSAVSSGRRGRRIKTPAGEILFYSISPELFFGFERQKNGVAIALPEKAFLDILYFYTKGRKFVIDPRNEINISKLNKKKIVKYLQSYKNPKFVKFITGLIHDKQQRKKND